MTFFLIIANCVYRYLKDRANRGSEMSPLASLDHSSDIRLLFPSDVQTQFKNICQLAFSGIHENKLIFFPNDLLRYGLSAPLCSLGLLHEVESFASVSRSVSYNFLHLSVQEFLAAFHVSEKIPADQSVMFDSLVTDPMFVSVLQFYAGITKLDTPGVQNVITRVIENQDKFSLVSVIRCLHETSHVQLCLSVANMLRWELDLLGCNLSPTDYLAIGYFSSCVCNAADSQHDRLSVFLTKCSLDDISVKYLMRGIIMSADSSAAVQSGNTCILYLNLQCNNILSNGAHFIAEALKKCNLISKLILNCNNGIKEEGLRHIAEALVFNSSLVQLDLLDCAIEITDHSGPAVAEMLAANRSLQLLDLSKNTLTDVGGVAIAKSLKHNVSLKELKLSSCHISSRIVKSLADSLRVNTSLEVLRLNDNEIRDREVGLLADALKVNRSLQCLVVANNGISDTGVEDLAEMLVVNNTLQQLDLSQKFNDIKGPGLQKLGACLKTNRTLWKLELSMPRDLNKKQFVLSLSDNCCLRELVDSNNMCYYESDLEEEMEEVNTTRKQRGHPELKLLILPET